MIINYPIILKTKAVFEKILNLITRSFQVLHCRTFRFQSPEIFLTQSHTLTKTVHPKWWVQNRYIMKWIRDLKYERGVSPKMWMLRDLRQGGGGGGYPPKSESWLNLEMTSHVARLAQILLAPSQHSNYFALTAILSLRVEYDLAKEKPLA